MDYFLKDWEEILHVADFLVVNQDVRIVVDGFHLVGVGHEIGGNVASVELHAFHHFDLRRGAFGLLDGDDTLLLDLLHRFGDNCTDRVVVVCGDGGHLLNLFVVVTDGLRPFFQVFHHGGDSLVNAAFQVHGVGTGGDIFQTVVENDLCQNRGGRGAVTGLVVGLGGNLLHHLRTHVLDGLLQLDLLGDRHAVLGDLRSTEFLVDNDVAAFRTKCDLHRIGQSVHTFFQTFPGFPVI